MPSPLALLRLLLLALISLTSLPALAEDPLPPEQAFVATLRELGPDRLEITYSIAPGYYLYRDKLRAEAEPESVELGPLELPPGKLKHDEFFGEVATYRDSVRFEIPVNRPADLQRYELTMISQGCADMGVCYPPLRQPLIVDQAHGATTFNATGGGNLLTNALQSPPPTPGATPAPLLAATSSQTTAPAQATTPPPTSADDSSRISRLLQNASLPLVLSSFFGFGLLLAFTPCTFPMIPILSGIIVGKGHSISRGHALALSIAYVLGMAATYAVAGVAAGLSGTLLSAALQNVWVLGAFAAIFVALALSMFGFYELQLPTALQSRLTTTASHQQGGHFLGVMTMGILSALIVGPCVAAPLAGALLYIAQSRDAALGGAALFAMGLGMGAPLVILSVAARHLLPKPGPWMEGVRKAFGVILLAVALWMLSPVLPALATMLAWAALLIFPAIYLHALDPLPPHASSWQRFWKGVGVVALLGGTAMLVGALAGSRDPLQPLAILRAQAAQASQAAHFERVRTVAELDARLASADRPVMLDFYADWCVSCKEMERFTFSDPQVASRMNQLILLQADITANSADDDALRARFGLFSAPAMLFFGPGGREIDGTRIMSFVPAADFLPVVEKVLADKKDNS